MPLGPGVYIAEEVLPWIDASGKLVPATGGRAVGTPAPSTGGSPPSASPPPDGGPPAPAGAQQHPVQPRAAAPHAPVVNVRQWRELEDRDEPYNPHRPPTQARTVQVSSHADSTALLRDHSHARVVPLGPAQIAHGLDEGAASREGRPSPSKGAVNPSHVREAFALAEARKVRTPEDFAIVLLTYTGLPVNKRNVKALLQWESSEGTFAVPARHYPGAYSPAISGYHNPLNTGFLYEGKGPRTPGASRPNLQAAQYPTWKMGVEASAFSLREHQYAGILNALKHSKGGQALEAEVHAEHWGTGPWSTAPLAPYTYTPYQRSPFQYGSSG